MTVLVSRSHRPVMHTNSHRFNMIIGPQMKLLIGERVFDFMVRDALSLGVRSIYQSPANPRQAATTRKRREESRRRGDKRKHWNALRPIEGTFKASEVNIPADDYTNRAVRHADMVKAILNLPWNNTTESIGARIKDYKPSAVTSIFRLADLPPEIRAMIYKIVFLVYCDDYRQAKPRLIHAARRSSLILKCSSRSVLIIR